MKKFRLRPLKGGYNIKFDSKQDPRVPNVFAAASFRFGHTMIPEEVVPLDESGQPPPSSTVTREDLRLDINDVQFRFDLLKYLKKIFRIILYLDINNRILKDV